MKGRPPKYLNTKEQTLVEIINSDYAKNDEVQISSLAEKSRMDPRTVKKYISHLIDKPLDSGKKIVVEKKLKKVMIIDPPGNPYEDPDRILKNFFWDVSEKISNTLEDINEKIKPPQVVRCDCGGDTFVSPLFNHLIYPFGSTINCAHCGKPLYYHCRCGRFIYVLSSQGNERIKCPGCGEIYQF